MDVSIHRQMIRRSLSTVALEISTGRTSLGNLPSRAQRASGVPQGDMSMAKRRNENSIPYTDMGKAGKMQKTHWFQVSDLETLLSELLLAKKEKAVYNTCRRAWFSQPSF